MGHVRRCAAYFWELGGHVAMEREVGEHVPQHDQLAVWVKKNRCPQLVLDL